MTVAALQTAGRVLALTLIVAGFAAVWTHRADIDPAAIKAAIESYPAAPLLFLAVHVIASLFFVPRTLLGLVAGAVWGLWQGLVWATLGSVLGAVAGFLIARYVNDGLVDLEAMPRVGPMLLRAEAGGWRAVTMLRLIPVIPHSLTNYALGLTKLSLADYTIGSFLGQLPMTIAYVGFGAAGGQAAGGQAWLAPVVVGAAALALSILLPRWRKARS